MKIAGFLKLSMLDFPNLLAATIFCHGCNLRCPFCHNPLLVVDSSPTLIDEDDVFGYLKKRKGVLKGVCISGGEPLLHGDIAEFIAKIRQLGLKIKLDTNGCFPDRLSQLMEKGLIDYVAMDIKNSLEGYPATVGIPDFDTTPVQKSVEILQRNTVPYEFRTTLIKELHSKDDLEQIGRWLKGNSKYYLQSFVRAESIVGDYTNSGSLTAFSTAEMNDAKRILSRYIQEVELRGI